MYAALPHHYWQGFSALIICSATSDEAKTLLYTGALSNLREFFAAETLQNWWKMPFVLS